MQTVAIPIDSNSSANVLGSHKNLFVKQTKKGCLQTLLGCDAKNEYKIATIEHQNADLFYAMEESSFCNRLCCGPIHSFTMNVSTGAEKGGKPMVRHERPLNCPAHNCKCCCYQEIQSFDAVTNESFGTIKEEFWFCIPSFKYINPQGIETYKLHMPTCCGGMCVDLCKEGCCNCRVPIYIYAIENGTKHETECGKIVKVWAGLANELADADKFECIYPEKASVGEKAAFLGATFLFKELFFARDRNET